MRARIVATGLGLWAAACGGDGNGPSSPAAHLVFSVEPTAGTTGQVITPPVAVSIEDASGRLVSNAQNAVTLSLEPNPTGAVLGGTSTVNATGGKATFVDLRVGHAGNGYALAASSPGLTSASSAAFNVAAGLAAAIAPSAGDGQTSAVGTAVTQPPSVIITDVNGNPMPDIAVTFAVTAGGGSVEGAAQISGIDGIAAVGRWTLGSSEGSNTLSAASDGLAGSPVIFNATATPLAASVTVEVRNNFFRSLRNGSGGGPGLFENYARDTIAVGGTVTWVWVGQNHNVTPAFGGGPSLSGTQDAPFTLGPITFDSPGTYTYRCTNHSQVVSDLVTGMAGIVVIR